LLFFLVTVTINLLNISLMPSLVLLQFFSIMYPVMGVAANLAGMCGRSICQTILVSVFVIVISVYGPQQCLL